ncbi:Aminodeoxychorismate lyase [Recurvomyces mirabilis]|nr:Aminodeoxychorismate lyase [Recurvomyces mirabilis]
MTHDQPNPCEEPHVFTTVRYDLALLKSAENTEASCHRPCPFYMLEHHWTRLQVAKWNTSMARSSPSELLQGLLHGVSQWHAKNPGKEMHSLRCKHRVYPDGHTTSEIAPTPSLLMDELFPRSLINITGGPGEVDWVVYIDPDSCEVSASTMYKTWDRFYYDRARNSTGILHLYDKKEVLLHNTDGEILDASISTPYFFRDGRWVTPAAVCGGQQGTTRRWSLEQRLCEEAVVEKDSMRNGEIVWLSNAVRGYYRARFVERINED